MEKFFEKSLSFWKILCLPAKIQLLLLKICNHNLKLNNQIKHYALDDRGVRVKPECTFCKITEPHTDTKETYRHFFLDFLIRSQPNTTYNYQTPPFLVSQSFITTYNLVTGMK